MILSMTQCRGLPTWNIQRIRLVLAAGWGFFQGFACCGAALTPFFPADGERMAHFPSRLHVVLSDASQTNGSYSFHLRPAARPDFSIIALPDTQNYCARKNGGTPEMFAAQVDWIVANRTNRNIVCVTHLGDIVENGDIQPSAAAEWLVATNSMHRLEDPLATDLEHGIPYSVAMGNHDGNQAGGYTAYSYYKDYSVWYNWSFGASRFAERPWFGGYFGTNNNNHFLLFSAGGLDFVLLQLEYACGTNTEVMEWANQVLQSNRHRKAIVVSHSLLYSHGANNTNPFHRDFSPEGRPIYDALKGNTNIFLMLCGHDPQTGYRKEIFNDNTIHIMLANYENAPNGGDGWLRILEFSPTNNVIRIRTYSPTLKRSNTQQAHSYDLPLDMHGFTVVSGSNTIVPGLITSAPLPALTQSEHWEWFVEVKNETSVSRSSVSRFTVGSSPAAPPKICSFLLNAEGHVLISWLSLGGKRYRLEFSDGDADGSFTGVFQEIVRPEDEEFDPAPAGTSGLSHFMDDFTFTGGPPVTGARYFRIKELD
jgi:3',5'-cyclic AMP phosphodiesterase CpdA